MVQRYTNWPIERIENSETDPSIYGAQIYSKTGIIDHWGKGWTDFSVYQVGARDAHVKEYVI